jgi:predicted amidohydrolase
MKSHIGVVQMQSSEQLTDNLKFAHSQIKYAADKGIDLLAFPETFLYIGQDNQKKHRIAEALDGPIVETFQGYAQHYNMSILMGSIYEKIADDPDRLYNTSIFINRQGKIKAVYRKIHLFDAPILGHYESDGIKAGNDLIVFDHEVGRIGLSICYDLRFPELYRHLTAQGAEIIFVPAAFFLYTGKHHWLQLLVARAIENQVYIIAPNQWGQHYEGRISYGSSVIIDPWGSIVCCATEQAKTVSTIIDLSFLKEVRQNMPISSHRRPSLYQENN